MLGFLLDAASVAFLIYMLKKCAKRTKLRNAVESIAYILSACVCVPVAAFLGSFCYRSFYRPVIVERVRSLVETSGDVDASVDPIARIMTGMPATVNNGVRIYGNTQGESLTQLNRLLSGDLTAVTGEIVDIIAGPVIDGVLRALFFGLLFAGCYRFFRAFYPTIEAYFYNPDRAAVSPTVCMVLGTGKVIVVFLAVLSMIALVGPVLPDWYIFRPSSYSHSFLFRLFDEDNLIMLFLGKGLTVY